MAALLKKKNYNTTKGSKRWRKNIDATELEEKVAAVNQEKYEQAQLEAKLKKTEKVSFKIDTEGDKKIREALAKDRFVKKIDESGISVQEMKKYRKIAKGLNTQNKKVTEKKPEPSTNEITESDLWSDKESSTDKTAPLISRKDKVAHVVPPTSGMSYNPSYKEHQGDIEEAIALEDHEAKAKRLEKVKRIRKQKKDIKEFERVQAIKKELSLNPVQKQKRDERKLAHLANTLKQVKKDIRNEDKQLELKLQEKQLEKEHEAEVKAKLGLNFKPQKLGMKKYRQKGPDFILEEDLPDNLRTVQNASSLLRDEYESVFRKGMLEPKNYFKTDKKSRVPAIKFRQKFDPYFKSEWEDVETALNVTN